MHVESGIKSQFEIQSKSNQGANLRKSPVQQCTHSTDINTDRSPHIVQLVQHFPIGRMLANGSAANGRPPTRPSWPAGSARAYREQGGRTLMCEAPVGARLSLLPALSHNSENAVATSDGQPQGPPRHLMALSARRASG